MVDFDYYTNTYKGYKCVESKFDNYAFKTNRLLKSKLDNFDNTTDDAKSLMCEIIDVLCEADNPISESVGGYSVNYGNQKLSIENSITSLIQQYFPFNGKYRGVGYVY